MMLTTMINIVTGLCQLTQFKNLLSEFEVIAYETTLTPSNVMKQKCPLGCANTSRILFIANNKYRS